MKKSSESERVVPVGRCYINSPIVEAVCEFRFTADSYWDMAIPGMLYDQLRDEFPNRRSKKQFGVQLNMSAEHAAVSNLAPSELAQFYSKDELALVQVGERLLTANKLRPYGEWDEFRNTICRVFEGYLKIASPTGLTRLGLRYINVITFDSETIDLDTYFRFRPVIGDALHTEISSFMSSIEIPFESARDSIRVTLAKAVPQEPTSSSVLLDIDYGLVKPTEVALGDCLGWVETAHRHVEETFEACISDALRQKFGVKG